MLEACGIQEVTAMTHPDPNYPDNPDGDVTCENCGLCGYVDDFEQLDKFDSACPRCGERQQHTYEI